MSSATLMIPGPPVPKGRPRRGAGGRWYTPTRTRRAEEAIAWEARAARARFDQPVKVGLVFHVVRGVGDVDNLAKTVLDGLVKGELLADDDLVVVLNVRIERCEPGQERTEATVEAL